MAALNLAANLPDSSSATCFFAATAASRSAAFLAKSSFRCCFC